LVGGNGTHYGFRYAGNGTAYEVNPETMPLVRRMFRMVGEEGQSLTAVKTAFERECIPTPKGKTYWNISTVKRVLENDVYLTRPAREVAALVEPEVAEKLDPDKRYGVFWFGKSRQKLTYGRKRKLRITEKDRAGNRQSLRLVCSLRLTCPDHQEGGSLADTCVSFPDSR
jgi:hypothetical protein